MPSQILQYTLVGFSDKLDWRPLRFAKSIPQNKICTACGLVRRNTALLPCLHVLCDFCYEQCAQDGSRVCPVDGLHCHDEDVDWKHFPPNELLKRKVKCWNAGSGCEAVMAASRIIQHFRHECAHHSVCCPKCSATVSCSGMCTHLRWSCHTSETETPPESKCDRRPNCKDGTVSTNSVDSVKEVNKPSFRDAFEEQAHKIEMCLEHIASGITTYADRLNKMSCDMNAYQESLMQELAAERTKIHDMFKKSMHADSFEVLYRNVNQLECMFKDVVSLTRETRANLSKIAVSMEAPKTEANEKSLKALDHIKKILRHAKHRVGFCVFFIKSVTSLQDTAVKKGRAVYNSEHVYLCGYCMSPGVELRWDGETVKLHARFRLVKGHMDGEVPWPLEHTVKLSVIHPKGGSKRTIKGKTSRSFKSCQRPKELKNSKYWLLCKSFLLENLISAGYLQDDQLRVMFQLLP